MSQESIQRQIVSALGPLVVSRVYARTFLQPDGSLPEWPAIRMSVISGDDQATVCGNGGDEATDYRIQIDVVDDRKKGEASFLSLVRQVKVALAAIDSTFVLAGQQDGFDEVTRTNRCSLDYMVYQSN